MSERISDPARCIEQLIDYLELNTANRVRAKLGRHQKLETVKLSNLQASAALSHCSSIVRRLPSFKSPSTMTVHLKDDQKVKLYGIFVYYSSYGEKGRYSQMSRTQFLKFVRDAGLATPELDIARCNLLFDKVRQLHTTDGCPVESRMSLAGWLQALLYVASKKYGFAQDPQEAFEYLISEHLDHLSGTNLIADDHLASTLHRPDVQAVLKGVASPLHLIFDFYSAQQEFYDHVNTPKSQLLMQITKALMPLDAFLRFAHDFEILPGLLTKVQLVSAFRQSKFSGEKVMDSSQDIERLTLQDFSECIGRCALMAYYEGTSPIGHAPQDDGPPTLRFSGHYSSDAKRMWVSEINSQAMKIPSDFMLRVSSLTLTSRHSDDGRRSTNDQEHRISCPSISAPSSPSASQYLQKRTARLPTHLARIEMDWVGRPSSCPASYGTLKSTRSKSSSPVGPHAMSQMLGRRIQQEQDQELMRLQLLAEARLKQMDLHRMAASRHLEIQDQSNQLACSQRLKASLRSLSPARYMPAPQLPTSMDELNRIFSR